MKADKWLFLRNFETLKGPSKWLCTPKCVRRYCRMWIGSHETIVHHRGICDQHEGAALMYWSTSAPLVLYTMPLSWLKAKSLTWQGYLSRRLRNRTMQQPIYSNADDGQLLGGCPCVHHTPCTSACGCLFPSLTVSCVIVVKLQTMASYSLT